MDLNEIVKKLSSAEIPEGTLGGGGVIALLFAVWVAKRSVKFILVLVGLALLAGAVLWHLHNRQ